MPAVKIKLKNPINSILAMPLGKIVRCSEYGLCAAGIFLENGYYFIYYVFSALRSLIRNMSASQSQRPNSQS